MRRLLSTILALVAAIHWANPAQAKTALLTSVEWAVANSDLVVVARPARVEESFTLFDVVEKLRGDCGAQIKVHWNDQRLVPFSQSPSCLLCLTRIEDGIWICDGDVFAVPSPWPTYSIYTLRPFQTFDELLQAAHIAARQYASRAQWADITVGIDSFDYDDGAYLRIPDDGSLENIILTWPDHGVPLEWVFAHLSRFHDDRAIAFFQKHRHDSGTRFDLFGQGKWSWKYYYARVTAIDYLKERGLDPGPAPVGELDLPYKTLRPAIWPASGCCFVALFLLGGIGRIVRFRGRRFGMMAMVSLGLCLASAAMWIRGRNHLEDLVWADQGVDHEITLTSGHIRFLRVSGWPIGTAPSYLSLLPADDPFATAARPAHERKVLSNGFEDGSLDILGLGNTALKGVVSPMQYSAITVAYWPLIVLFAILPLFRINRMRRGFGKGACQQCGFDLRASPERCPECGTPTPPPKLGGRRA